jgi:hypothetical protein
MGDVNGLHLARGTHRDWLTNGEMVGIMNAPTHFGKVSYQITYHSEEKQIAAKVQLSEDSPAEWLVLHIRLPEGYKVTSMQASTNITLNPEGTEVFWNSPSGEATVTLNVEKQ